MYMRLHTVKPAYNGPVYSAPVYSGDPVYYSHQTTSQKFQLPYIFCKVDLYLYSGHPVYNGLLPFPKGDHCTQA